MAAAGRPTGTAAELTVVPAERAVPLPDEAGFDVGASLGVPRSRRTARSPSPRTGRDQLLALMAAGQTILLVEHRLDLVMTLSDRVLVMDDGRLIAQGAPADVRTNPAVVEAYLAQAGREGPGPITRLLELDGIDVLEHPPARA